MKMKKAISLTILAIIIVLLIIYALSLGTVDISFIQTIEVLKDIVKHTLQANIISDTIYYLRLPRFLLALVVGCGLAVSGAVMQAVMKNGLADPYLMGISSGASLGAVLAVALGFSHFAGFDCIGIFAFVGAMGATVIILLLALKIGQSTALLTLLAGLAINAVCTAVVSLLLTIYADTEGIQTIMYWLMGSLLQANWERILYLAPVIIIFTIFFWSRYRVFNMMLLGDEEVITLGHDLTKSRRIYIFLSAIMVGLIVYNAGMIGFIGLIVPHITRILVGNNHMFVLPLCGLIGATVLAWADVISRNLIPGSEIPIGVIVALLGAPIFVYLLMSKKYGYAK